MKIEFDLPEKISTNKIYAGVHWAVRAKQANLYHSCLGGNPPFAGDYPVHIRYDFTFKSRALDSSNCTYMLKLCEDSLVGWGVIPADDPVYVAMTSITSKKGEKDHVTITITEYSYETTTK